MQSTVVENGIKARYIGQNVGARLIHGNDGRVYRGGNNRDDRFQYLHPDDVELLKDSFAVVEAPKPTINNYSNTITASEGVTDEQAATAFASIEPLESADQPRKRGTK